MNSDEQPCAQEEYYDCMRCMGRFSRFIVPADTEVLDKLEALSFLIEQREKMISQLSFS